jgi:hypothetical protein
MYAILAFHSILDFCHSALMNISFTRTSFYIIFIVFTKVAFINDNPTYSSGAIFLDVFPTVHYGS